MTVELAGLGLCGYSPVMLPVARAVAIGALLAAAGCAPKPPEGFRRFYPDFYARQWRLDPRTGSLFYLLGAYPAKTYLGRIEIASGKVDKWRFQGNFLNSYALDPEGKLAFLSAMQSTGQTNSEWILGVDLSDGKQIWQAHVPSGSNILGMVKPPGQKLFCFLGVGDETVLKAFDIGARKFEDAKPLGRFQVESLMPLGDGRRVLLSATAADKWRLMAVDLPEGVVRTGEFASRLSGFAPDSDGLALAFYRIPGDDRSAIVQIDPSGPSVKEIARIEGEVESVARADKALLAVAKDFSRPRDTKRNWLHPRTISRVADGVGAKGVEWTQRAGRFLPGTAPDGSLLFSIEDGDAPAVWAIPLRDDAIAAAGPALDRKYHLGVNAPLVMAIQLVALVVAAFCAALFWSSMMDFLNGR